MARLPQRSWVSETAENVSNYWRIRESPIYYAINGTLTGDISQVGNMLNVWVPETGKRYLLRGGRLTIVCTVTCTGTGADVLFLCDQGTLANVFTPLAAISLSMPAGTVVGDPIEFDFGSGVYSQNVDSILRVAANGTIGTGVLRVTGILYGDEVIG